MPYENQYGSKTAHIDIVKNPDVQKFLKQCAPIKHPTDVGTQELLKYFKNAPDYDNECIVQHVIASDGSKYTSSINEQLPSIKAAYLKFSTILIEMSDFDGLQDLQTELIDPFKVASLQKNRDALSLVLPLSNLKLPEDESVRDTFRKQTERFLLSEETRFKVDNNETSLLHTLTELALLRPGSNGKVRVHKCPQQNCDHGEILLDPTKSAHKCPRCEKPVYFSDCLRLWEVINDFHSNEEAISRFMIYMEHLLPVHYLRFLRDFFADRLEQVGLLIDGPLAIFGQAAWLHSSIMSFVKKLIDKQKNANKNGPLVIGLQKTGYVVEYMNLLQKRVKSNQIFLITDEFRYKYLGVGRSGNGFGYETYYGQEFAFKTPSGKMFVFSLPYPLENKTSGFVKEKENFQNYHSIKRVLRLITEVETDLFKNAVIPIALAHKYAAISLNPGGRVLDILGRASIG